MFASNFAEARLVFDANNPPSLPLTDDNVDTALRLCGILHGCYSCDDDGTFGDSESSSTPSWSAHEDGARARQAVIDLAQLSHKWDCAESARGEILRMVGKVAGNWPSYWSKVADLTMSYFLEDAETFRGATAQVIARCDGGEAIKPTVVSKQGVTSLTQWPDLLDRPDFRETLSSAVDTIRNRLLDNLQLVVDHFRADRSRWYLNPDGWFHDGPFDEKWRGRGPPSLLHDYIDHFHECPYVAHEADSSSSEDDDYEPLPTLVSMIKTVERLNEGVYRDIEAWPLQRWVESARDQKDALNTSTDADALKTFGWKQHGLYLKSDDGSDTLLYFYDAVKAAVNDACSIIDQGVCMEYVRAGTQHQHGKCMAYPCWEQQVTKLSLEGLWEKWRLWHWGGGPDP